MTIGFDAKRAFCNVTGLGNYSRMVIMAVARIHPDASIVLFTPAVKGQYADFFAALRNVTVVRPTGLWRFFPSLWRTVGLRGEVRRRGVSLFHGLSHELPLLLPRKVRQVVTMHDLIVWRFPTYFPLVDRLLYKAKQRHACRRADRIVAVSRQTADDVEQWLRVPADRVRVVYQSCDGQFFLPVDSVRRHEARVRYGLPERYLLAVGTVERRKNLCSVVHALASLPTDVHLVVVGRHTPYFDEVLTAVRQLRLSERVHFVDKVQFEDLPALYVEAQASVYMSIFEGFGIPVLESLACGTPVVASRASSIPEVGGDCALYADPNDPSDIARQLASVLDDDVRQRLVGNIGPHLQRFRPDTIAAELFALYESLSD